MGVLNPIVLAKPPRSVDVSQFQQIQRRAVGGQPVRCDALGLDRLVVQQALQQPRCSLRIPPALDHDVQDLAFVINRAPEVYVVRCFGTVGGRI